MRPFRPSYAKRRAKARLRMLRRSCEGRGLGWFLELRGRRLARLTEPQYYDMFWVQYCVTPMPGISWETLANSDLWVTSDALTFRNAGTGDVAPCAFQGGRVPSADSPHVTMRALYIELPPRWLRDYEWWEAHPVVGAIVLSILLLALTEAVRFGARELFQLTIVE